MADETLLEPLVADQEGYEFPFDESLLKELAALDAAEAGIGEDGQQAEHVEDEDVYKMKELIRQAFTTVLACSTMCRRPTTAVTYLQTASGMQRGDSNPLPQINTMQAMHGLCSQGEAQGCAAVP